MQFWQFWQFFKMGWNGCALLVRPSRIPHRNSKKSFCCGCQLIPRKTEKVKIGGIHFSKVQSGKITVWYTFLIKFQVQITVPWTPLNNLPPMKPFKSQKFSNTSKSCRIPMPHLFYIHFYITSFCMPFDFWISDSAIRHCII